MLDEGDLAAEPPRAAKPREIPINQFPRTLVYGLFKIPGFSGRRYFKRLVPPPFFLDRGSAAKTLITHTKKTSITQYRQLRRLPSSSLVLQNRSYDHISH